MNCGQPLDLERYRRLKGKEKASPRAAVVCAASKKDASLLSPDPQKICGNARMPVASAYREAPPTPILTSGFSCGGIAVGLAGAASSKLEAGPAQSLFDETRRQRYEKIKTRMRKQGRIPAESKGRSLYARPKSTVTRSAEKAVPSSKKGDSSGVGGRRDKIGPSRRSAFSTPRQSNRSTHGHESGSYPAPPSVSTNQPLERVSPGFSPDKKADMLGREHMTTEASMHNMKSTASPSFQDQSEKNWQHTAGAWMNGQSRIGPSTPCQEQYPVEDAGDDAWLDDEHKPHVTEGTIDNPILAIDPDAPPTPIRPVLSQSSSNSGVSPPTRHPTLPTPRSNGSSMGTTSTGRKDRILESRGISEDDEEDETREPLSELAPSNPTEIGVPVGGNGFRVESPGSLMIRHSLEMPSLKSWYSTGGSSRPSGSAPRIQKGEGRTTLPLSPIDTGIPETIPSLTKETPSNAMGYGGTHATPKSRDAEAYHIYRVESPATPSTPSLDQGTVRLLYSSDFAKMIQDSQECESDEHQGGYFESPRRSVDRNGVSLVIRKRPLLKEELDRGEFDVVKAEETQVNTIRVYNTSLLPDLKTKRVSSASYTFDHVFSEGCTAEELYISAAQSGVVYAKDGGSSVFVVFGSSGSGKTYTMTDIEERAAFDVFEPQGHAHPLHDGQESVSVSVQYLELAGNRIVDLLGPVGSFVRVVQEHGSFQLKGSVSKSASEPHELLAIISDAKRRLATQDSVSKQDSGAPSFTLCRMEVMSGSRMGCLLLLECPVEGQSMGSLETTDFNDIIESIRARVPDTSTSSRRRPGSNVAKLLQDSLGNPSSRISLFTTVSPCATSTEGTLAALSSAVRVMHGHPQRFNEKSVTENNSPKNSNDTAEPTPPRQWGHNELVDWMSKKSLLGEQAPLDVNGRYAMRMSKLQLNSTFYDSLDNTKAEKLYLALRAENDRVARMRVKVRMARQLEQLNP